MNTQMVLYSNTMSIEILAVVVCMFASCYKNQVRPQGELCLVVYAM